MKILIVDDQREVRRMICDALQSQFPNAILQDVPSAEEAMVLLSRDRFDLLVVDVRLAGMSGLEMVEKARRRQADLKIVVVTGLNDPAIHQQLSEAPIQAWFPKPLSMDSFLTYVSTLLGEPSMSLSVSKPEPDLSAEKGEEELAPGKWDALCESLGLSGLQVVDLAGNLLAQSKSLPAFLDFSRLMAYFQQAESEVRKLQTHYGAEALTPLVFYLTEDYAVCQLGYEGYRIVFWGEKKGLPAHPIELQLAMTQKGQELLEALRRDSSVFAQFSTSERPGAEENQGTTVAADVSLEALLQNPSPDLIPSEQVDEFWEQSLANGDWQDSSRGSQTLPFHQARQLGILPPDENEASLKD
jgi:CheY-like chemotaxis protein